MQNGHVFPAVRFYSITTSTDIAADGKHGISFHFYRRANTEVYALVEHGVLWGSSQSQFYDHLDELDTRLSVELTGATITPKARVVCSKSTAYIPNGTWSFHLNLGTVVDKPVFMRTYLVLRHRTTNEYRLVMSDVVYRNYLGTIQGTALSSSAEIARYEVSAAKQLTALADAIRAKTGRTDKMSLDEMRQAVESLVVAEDNT